MIIKAFTAVRPDELLSKEFPDTFLKLNLVPPNKNFVQWLSDSGRKTFALLSAAEFTNVKSISLCVRIHLLYLLGTCPAFEAHFFARPLFVENLSSSGEQGFEEISSFRGAL